MKLHVNGEDVERRVTGKGHTHLAAKNGNGNLKKKRINFV